MKRMIKLALIALTCIAANADILRLHDGRVFAGQFLGATRTEIWFQRDAPGDVLGTVAYPVTQVESLTFSPQSGPIGQASSVRPAGASAEPQPFLCAFSLSSFGRSASRSAQCNGGLSRLTAKADKDLPK
jgi:hypothetical protein